MTSLSSLNAVLYSWERRELRESVLQELRAVADAPTPAPNDTAPDDASYLLTVARSRAVAADPQVFSGVSRALRVVLERQRNRAQLTGTVPKTVATMLDVAASVGNDTVCLDACYLLHRVLQANDAAYTSCVDSVRPLIVCLGLRCAPLHIVASAVLQTLCLRPLGRELLLQCDGVARLVALLFAPSDVVVTRAVAALHCATADLNVARAVCEAGGVQPVLSLTDGCCGGEAVRHASGALQNMSRDRETADLLSQAGAAELLLRVVGGGDASLQASAIGAVLNMHQGDDESRDVLKQALSSFVAAAHVEQLVEGIAG